MTKKPMKKDSPKFCKTLKDTKALIAKHRGGIRLDVGCGFNKQKGYVGLDMRPVKGVDIVHDAEATPYPLPKECCSTILASHLVEHLCPKNFMRVMDEWWRLLRAGGQLLVSLPYATSYGFYQDPTHCNHVNEATWTYFDPEQFLYCIYRPLPWKVERNAWREGGNMEVILSKRTIAERDAIDKKRGIKV